MVKRPFVSWLTSSVNRLSTVKWTLPAPQVEPIFQVTTGRLLSPAAMALALAVSMVPDLVEPQPASKDSAMHSVSIIANTRFMFPSRFLGELRSPIFQFHFIKSAIVNKS